jgi:hypothetical protein
MTSKGPMISPAKELPNREPKPCVVVSVKWSAMIAL